MRVPERDDQSLSFFFFTCQWSRGDSNPRPDSSLYSILHV